MLRVTFIARAGACPGLLTDAMMSKSFFIRRLSSLLIITIILSSKVNKIATN